MTENTMFFLLYNNTMFSMGPLYTHLTTILYISLFSTVQIDLKNTKRPKCYDFYLYIYIYIVRKTKLAVLISFN